MCFLLRPHAEILSKLLPDAASPPMTFGVSKKEHSTSGNLFCQESVFSTFTKSDGRFSGSLV